MSSHTNTRNYITLLLALVIPLAATACDEGELPAEGYVPAPEKYPTLPDDGPVDLSVPPDAILTETFAVEAGLDETKRYVIQKQAGKHYTIGLTQLTADLDMFGHWLPDVSRSVYQFPSWAYGTSEEQIGFTASESGNYYLAVHGYQAGKGILQIYESTPPPAPEDEVIWPVEWASDESSDAQLLSGGLNWLESYDYGGSCGVTRHPGLDLNFNDGGGALADLGLPVFAIADGVVHSIGRNHPSWGNVLEIAHELSDGTRVRSLLGHVGEIYVNEGQAVRQGEVVATIGDPPTTTPHLHFEIRHNTGLSTFAFPCRHSVHSVLESYHDPRAFVVGH